MIYLLLLALLVPGLATAHPLFTNEPPGFEKYYECEFDNDACGMVSRSFNGVTPPFAYASPWGNDRAMDEYMLKGSRTGNGQWGLDFPKQTEVFLSFLWNSTAYGYPNSNNKLIFIKNPSNSFLVWQGLPGPGAKQLKWYQQEELDNCHIPGYGPFCWNSPDRDGTGWFPANIDGSVAMHAPGGPPKKVEIYLKSSSCRTCKDGIIRIWADGKLSSEYLNVNQGNGTERAPESPGGFRNIEITSTWDGQYAATVDWHHYFYKMYVSFRKGGAPPVQPTPPPPTEPGTVIGITGTVK